MSQVRERPILFSGPMVRALLDGKKSQTRRVVKPQPDFDTARVHLGGDTSSAVPAVSGIGPAPGRIGLKRGPAFGYVTPNICCPYALLPGDRLWVRETWFGGPDPEPETFKYQATDPDFSINGRSVWRSGIIMPRKASRLSLEITGVRVERLQEISEDDAKAEGIDTSVVDPSPRGVAPIKPKNYVFARDCFQDLWNSLNAKRGYGWDVNPWVWVIEFQRIDPTASTPEKAAVR